ncbi:MAG: hypothetical protein KC619_21095 [Myxococcales bacterium]|nr:hypothetical protein [Myxococcales bacterium]
MRRGALCLVLCASLASCAASAGGSVTPARSEVLPMGSEVLAPLPDGTLIVESEGRLLQYDPRALDAEPVVVGPAADIGEVHAAVFVDGAILVLSSGGSFILRDHAFIESPLAASLDGPIRDAVQMPTPTGRGDGDLWIVTTRSLYRVADGVAERLVLDEPLEDAELALAQRPEGPALWVRLPDRVLEVWRDRSGVVRSAALILDGVPSAIGGDAELTGWLVIGGRLHSIGADRRLVDHGVEVARLLTSAQSREAWVIDASGHTWLHADGQLFDAPTVSVDATQILAVAADGALYASGAASIERFAPRRFARVEGAANGALLVTPQTFTIEVEGAPTVEATVDGAPVEVLADPRRVELDPVALGEGTHELVIRVAYDDGTLPVTDARRFEVITGATWEQDVFPLYEARCAACHGPEGSAVTRLGTAAEWQERIEVIVQNVEQGRMPLGRAPLSGREVALIQAWQVGGFAP